MKTAVLKSLSHEEYAAAEQTPLKDYSATAFFEPVILLPSQLAHCSAHSIPELKLVAAILEDALLCINRRAGARRGRRRREFMDAWHWLWNDRRDWPFAFRNVCDLLGLDAAAVRQHVRHVHDRL